LRTLRIALLAFAIATPAAWAAASYRIGTPALVPGKAASNQDSKKTGTKDLSCPTGYWMYAIDVDGGIWGTYPAIEKVSLRCGNKNGDHASARSFGKVATGLNLTISYGQGQCSGGTPALTGMNVNFDRYIKDVKVRCGGIVTSGSSVRVDDTGLQGSWLLNRVQNNDSQRSLKCQGNQVLSGLRISHRDDSNETAFTALQLLCSSVTA